MYTNGSSFLHRSAIGGPCGDITRNVTSKPDFVVPETTIAEQHDNESIVDYLLLAMKPGSPAQKLVLSQSTKRAKASATIRRLLVQFDPIYNTYTRSTEVQDAYNALAPS